MSAIRVARVRAELRDDSVVVATPTPRLSWVTETDTSDWMQTRAELELDGGQTVVVEGSASVLVPWPFAPIAPHGRHRVRIRVTGSDGIMSGWSDALPVEAGFLAPGEWVARFIQPAVIERDAQPARLRHEFSVTDGLVRATLFATAFGVYQARLNGIAVDDQVLKPGWTPYRDRLIHETTDVTDLLRPGANAVAVDLAGGWYTEHWFLPQARYGAQPSVALQIRLEYADGRVETVASDAGWRASGDGPILSSSLYDGEHYDARRETPGWDEPGFEDSGWQRVRFDAESIVPEARNSPAVRVTETIAPIATLTTPSGRQVLDFGQNLVGRARLRLRGAAGDVVTLRHAEVLEDGELGVRPLRAARATDTYVLRGDEQGEVWEPAFTFHGFRYLEVTGPSVPIDPADITAVVIHSDLRRTGWFESSHPQLDQLHDNVVWGMRGNFLYVPTDCPQRDERLGWTGDIQVFAPSASFLYDTSAFLGSWLQDLTIEQRAAGGSVPFVIPNVIDDAITPAAAWGDAATVVPTVLHERFGDREVLAAQYGSMRDWTDHILALRSGRGLWEDGFQFGDWLDPTAPPEDAFRAMTEHGIVATAYVIRSADLTARAALLLGHDDDAEKYRGEADRVREAFAAAYVDGAKGRMTSDAQTAYALAIAFDLVRDAAVRQRLGDRLAELVRDNGHRIGTGFEGTPIVTDALTATGHLDTAGLLLLETHNPSWLYPVTMGATTIWERWDSMLEDGSINPGDMTSFNHYALGAVADWMHRTVAGLAPAAPGYRIIRVAPQPLDGLEHASASLDSPYGPARVSWARTGSGVVVTAVVPPNTTAEVSLPDGRDTFVVGSGTHEWRVGV